MANNPYVNKVQLGNDVLIDLTGDDTQPSDVLSGKSFHLASGAPATGSLVPVLGIEVNGETKTPDSNGIVDIGNTGRGSSTALSLTLASGSWSSATPPTQTITATGVTASNNLVVGPAPDITSEQLNALALAKIMCISQDTDEITLMAYGEVPEVNIPISILIMG